jgi:hypothetical protein
VLASRLARNDKGLKVLLIDAGSDPRGNKHYQVPALHALATEDPDLRWDYFVEHFSDRNLAQEDQKYAKDKGIFYPRASAIGGCTAHHAMITIYPDTSDWDDIAAMTGDDSWNSDRMWSYFERCRDTNGFRWLDIEAAGFDTVLRAAHDGTVDQILLSAVVQCGAYSDIIERETPAGNHVFMRMPDAVETWQKVILMKSNMENGSIWTEDEHGTLMEEWSFNTVLITDYMKSILDKLP